MGKKNKLPIPISNEEVEAKGEPLETQKGTLEQNLNDSVYVNYNLLTILTNIRTELEQIKLMNVSILQIFKVIAERMLQEEQIEQPKEEKKEEREGVIR